MHPQSEMENYKLQVELLQEKLHRSEDNRQELENKLEQIMKKRNEHERTLRSRSQRKYQQFLDEQKKRNERNRMLVEMLERIDQQAAALSARSERLKMVKLQYELYFSKLVHSYSLKTLHCNPSSSFLPVQMPLNSHTSIKTDDVVPALLHNSTPQLQAVPIPVVVPIPNEQNRFQHSWAFATAPSGVLITLANNSALPSMDTGDNKKNESNFSFDYSHFPIGYLPTTATATAPTTATPMHCNVPQSYLQQTQQKQPSTESHSKPLFTPDDDDKPSRPNFEYEDKTPSGSFKTDETFSTRTQQEFNQKMYNLTSENLKKGNDLELKQDKRNGSELENLPKIRSPEMPNIATAVLRQSLEVDKLPNITPNNSFQKIIEDGRIEHRGNKPNTIDFRTDNDEYIKYIKEMKETYDKTAQAPRPFDVTPPEHNIDNITTTLRKQKIDEANVEDDEKINDVEDNEKNTSSAFPPLGGKCSMESIGDEALTKKPLKSKTEGNTYNAAARSTDPSRDTEQITLFNGTKNSKDERTGASNRTAAIIDGVGENTKNTTENTHSETSYRPLHFDKKEKMSIEKIETAIYGELLPKPTESLTSADFLDKAKGNKMEEEVEQNVRQPEQYEFNNSVNEAYEQDTVGLAEPQVELYPINKEQRDVKTEEGVESSQEAYNYTDNAQEYDIQNYNYSDLSQDYKDVNQETTQPYTYSDAPQESEQTNQQEQQSYNYSNQSQDFAGGNQEQVAPQQEYPFTNDGLQPQMDNYPTDYQNYEASQYQSEYDPNAYQYDYDQQQYNDTNQEQYAPEIYNPEYQPDAYSHEYSSYGQNASTEGDTSSQPYDEQPYIPAEEEPPEAQFETNIHQDQLEPEVEKAPPVDNSNEEVTPQKSATVAPTSILSTEKNPDHTAKKKKRVNFVDSETDESSTLPKPDVVSSESDFDFSTN